MILGVLLGSGSAACVTDDPEGFDPALHNARDAPEILDAEDGTWEGDPQAASEDLDAVTQEIIENLRDAGFDSEEIQVSDDGIVVVNGEAEISLDASWEILEGAEYQETGDSWGHASLTDAPGGAHSGLNVVTDIYLVASNLSTPPPGPAESGWALNGYWDADTGGALGTNGSTGSWMMAMYVRTRSTDVTATCVEAVHLQASNQGTLPASLYPNLTRRGYWDVDPGGAVGSNGTSGSYMTGLYIRSGQVSSGNCLTAVELIASNNGIGACSGSPGCIGWWDVDNGGGVGAYGTSGSYMMSLEAFTQ